MPNWGDDESGRSQRWPETHGHALYVTPTGMQQRILALVATTLSLIGAARHSQAQAQGFAINRFEPAERGSDWFVGESLDFRGEPSVAAGAVFDWAYAPLVLRGMGSPFGSSSRTVITDQILMHAGAAAVLGDRFRFALDLPVVLYQHGQALSGGASAGRAPDGARVGDLRLSSDVRLLGHYGSVFTSAVGAQVYLPTGSQASYTSDGTVRVTPRLLVAGDGEGLAYAAKLGFAFRPLDDSFEGRQLGHEVVFSIAAGARVNDVFVLGPELYGSTAVGRGNSLFAARGTPLELLIGAHLTVLKNWNVSSGIGPGLTRGDGSPTMRVTFSIEFAPDVCVDPDGDGICNPLDACPDVDGDRSAERSNNGCPLDRDSDGVRDKFDACPDRAGIRSDGAGKNGCPAGTEETPPPAVVPK